MVERRGNEVQVAVTSQEGMGSRGRVEGSEKDTSITSVNGTGGKKARKEGAGGWEDGRKGVGERNGSKFR